MIILKAVVCGVVAQVFLTGDTVGKAQLLQITLSVALFYLSDPVSHNSVTESHHAQHQHPETAINNFIIYTCLFPAVTSQCLP